jgi:tryptophanyl-tRNA synthetase
MSKNKKVAFSGIQPSGIVHVGNYLGAIRNWVDIQKEYDSLFSVVDLHAITVPQDPKKVRENTLNMIAVMLSAGIDPKKSTVFIQSHIPAHTELTWLLNTITHMGELNRMTQYKDKSEKFKNDTAGMGLFDYPILMAADILLYSADVVPVGEDQKQHVELTRDIAARFNSRFGETFKIPSPVIKKEGARIMGLDNPEKKMSKSAESEFNYITLTDNANAIKKKISRAVTDSESTIKYNPERKGLYNLITIYSLFSDIAPLKIEEKYEGKGYAEFKKDLAEIIIEKLAPFQTKYNKLISDKKYLLDVAKSGAKVANLIAEKKLKEVKEKIGLL